MLKGLVWKNTKEALPLECEPVFCKLSDGSCSVAVFCCDDEAEYWYREDRSKIDPATVVEWAYRLIVSRG